MEIYIWSSSKCVGFGSIVYHFYLLLRNWDCKKVPSITHAHHHLQCWFGPTPHCRKSYKQRGRLWIWCPEERVWKFGGKGHYWPHKGKMVLDILQWDSQSNKSIILCCYRSVCYRWQFSQGNKNVFCKIVLLIVKLLWGENNFIWSYLYIYSFYVSFKKKSWYILNVKSLKYIFILTSIM